MTTLRVVPPRGLVGRERPDAALPPARALAPGSPVRVVRTMGAWAEVDTDDGWSGWVDGRRLLAPVGSTAPTPPTPPKPAAPAPVAPAAPVPAAPVPASTQEQGSLPVPGGYASYAALFEAARASAAPAVPVPPAEPAGVPAPAAPAEGSSLLSRVPVPALVGAGLLAASAVLPWLRNAGRTLNPFDLPVAFLVDFHSTDTGGIDLGLLLLGLAIGAVLLASRPGLARWRRVVGGVAIVVPTLFTAQLQRVLGELPLEERPTLLATLGIGVLLAVLGGVLVLWGGPRRQTS